MTHFHCFDVSFVDYVPGHFQHIASYLLLVLGCSWKICTQENRCSYGLMSVFLSECN